MHSLPVSKNGEPPLGRRYLTKKETSDYLGLSIHTINGWISQGVEIPYMKFGTKKVMFDIEDLDNWAQKSKRYPREI